MVLPNNGVYFDESQFEEFGKLSNRNLEDPNVQRVNPDTTKRNPGDFALWKKKEKNLSGTLHGAKEDQVGTLNTAITEEYFGPQ